jgi:hypothetical protein
VTDQAQKVEGTSRAIQSGRDTIISHGVSKEEIKEIIEATAAAQLNLLTRVAESLINARLDDFKATILDQVENRVGAFRREAFQDPDFIYLLGRAQHAYARSGDLQLRDTLIDLIARRSQATGRTRLSLTLNEAVEKAACLTKNEFAELSAVYLLRYAVHRGIKNLQMLVDEFKRMMVPLLPDISNEPPSYEYLEAQACAKIEELNIFDLDRAFRENYCGVLQSGFERAEIEAILPEGKKNALDYMITTCSNDQTKLEFNNCLNCRAFLSRGIRSGLRHRELMDAYTFFESKMLTKEEIIKRLNPVLPEIERMYRLWSITPLKNLTLTSVGIAIAHSNLVRLADFEADLSIWIS